MWDKIWRCVASAAEYSLACESTIACGFGCADRDFFSGGVTNTQNLEKEGEILALVFEPRDKESKRVLFFAVFI